MLDTETCNGRMIDNKLDLSDSLVYDIGWQVIDKKGNVYARHSYIVREIYYEPELMRSAYYAAKIPMYEQDIAEGRRIVLDLYYIRKMLLHDCRIFNIKAIVAHNARFDYNALNTTQRWITKSKYRYFLPYGVPLYDTMKMALDVIVPLKGYINFCERNNYMTKHKKPRPRVTAEILYRYLSGDNNFVENHTGLEDVEIESYIFAVCMSKHKKMQKLLWNDKKEVMFTYD